MPWRRTPNRQDVFQVTAILEGVRRYTAKRGYEINIAWPIMYGGHPYHHIGMPGTIIMPHEVLMEQIISIMLGLWNDGFRKIILVNNHGHHWTLVAALQEFCKRHQLPGIFQVFDWPHVCVDFFKPFSGKDDEFKETFSHAGESETSLGLLMFPDMIDMEHAVDGNPKSILPGIWFDNSIDDYHRPHMWYEGEGHSEIEMSAIREGVGLRNLLDPRKAKRPVVCMAKLMVELVDNILAAFPSEQCLL